MNTSIFFIGLAKIGFGVVVAALGMFAGTRFFARLTKLGKVDEELAKGNHAVSVLMAAAVIALGLLAQHAVVATFSALDLAYRDQKFEPEMLLAFCLYGGVHVATALAVGLIVLRLGTAMFGWLTRGVDEMAEIRKGNLAPALVLGAVIVVLALMAAPGLEMALNGLLPLPELGRDMVLAP